MDEKLIDQFIADKVAEITKDVDTDVDLAYEALEQLWKIMAFENNGTTSRMADFFRLCTDAANSVKTLATSTESNYLIPTQVQQEDSTVILLESTVLPSTDEMSLGKSTSMSFTLPLAPEVLTKSNNIFTDGLETTIETIGIDSTKEMSTSMDTLDGFLEQSKLFPWLGSISVDQCNESSKYIDNLVLTFTANIRKDQQFFITAQEYRDSDWTDESDIAKYRECFDLIDLGKKIIETFFTVQDLIHKLSGSGFQECLVIMEELMAHHQNLNIPESNEDFDNRLESACSWRAEFAEKVRQEAEMRKANISKIRDEVHEDNNFLFLWGLNLDRVVNIYKISTDNLERYLSKDITKQELAQQWLSPENVNRRKNFLRGITDVENRRERYHDVIASIKYLFIFGYRALRYDKPRIINDSSVHDLELVKKGLTVKFISDHVTRGDIIWHIMDKFDIVLHAGPMKFFDTTVMNPLQDIREELEVFELNLREYQDSIKMDTQFYL